MSTQSQSFLATSLQQAEQIVGQLKAAGFTEDEISFLTPGRDSAGDIAKRVRAGELELEKWSPEEPILVSVHVDGGGNVDRAIAIFAKAKAEERLRAEDHYESSELRSTPIAETQKS